MGWQGGGLGVGETGRKTPILTTEAKARKPHDLERYVCVIKDTERVYGLPREGGATVQVEVSVRGRPLPGERHVLLDDPSTYFRPAIWGDGLKGVAEYAFPLPGEWAFRHSTLPLDKLDVSKLTKLFALQHRTMPTCVSTWERVLGHPLKWERLATKYSNAFLVHKDYHLHFCHILHRRLYTKDKQQAADRRCRWCNGPRETPEHLGSCKALDPLREWLVRVTGDYTWGEPETFLLGIHPQTTHARGACNLWLLMWASIIRNFVRTSTEGDPLNTDTIIKYTANTFVSRCKVVLNTATRQTLKIASRGGNPPVLYPKLSRLIEPQAEVSRDPKESIPTLSWSHQLHKTLVDHDLSHVLGSVDPVVFSEPGD
jgi:hypothetical protein